MTTLANVYVQIQGDWTRFRAEVRTEATRAASSSDFKVRPIFDAVLFRRQYAVFKTRYLSDQTFKVTPILTTLGPTGTYNDQSFKVTPLLDSTIFRQQMATFRLQFLRDQTFTITAHAATAAAAAQLAALQAQIAAIASSNPTVNPNVSGLNALSNAAGGAHSRMQLLITAGILLGPAIVPAAAAATGAILGLAASAAAAGAGLGVAVLALSGVVGALKAVSAARDAAARTNATAVRQDSQMAAGADALRSALAALANTRASAATSAVSAARAVAEAERDITRARMEAKLAMEDLASSVANNALSIRQAQLDLADAKKTLDAVLADPTASQRQRDQAQLTYDRAKQQLADLTTMQVRLGDQQRTTQQEGVDGSERVRTATQRLADAQRAAADQQRQSAASITAAVQAVAAAQRGMATAAVTASATAGSAMDTLAAKMGDLSAEGRRFTLFVFGLKQEFLGLRQAAERGFLPGVQRGIEQLLPLMPSLTNFVERVGKGLGDIADKSLAALAGSSWRPFFSYLSGSAVPTLRQMSATFGDIVTGLANMVLAFVPVQRQIGGGLASLAERFAAWSATLRTNRDFQTFLDYVITRGPVVMKTLGDLVSALMRIAIAAAPIGDVVLATLRALSAVIGAIPTPILTALVLAIGALRIAGLVAPLVMGLAAGVRSLTTGAAGARGAVTGLTAALGGPWVLAIAAATAVVGLLMLRSSQAKADVDRLKTALASYADALKGGFTPESDRATQAILAQDGKLRAMVRTLNELNVSQTVVLQALRGDKDARNEVIAALDRQIAAEKHLWFETRNGSDADTEASAKHKKRIGELEAQRKAIIATGDAQQQANDLTRKAAEEAEFLARAGGVLTVVQRALAEAHRILGDSTATVEQKTNALRVANKALHEAAISQIEAQERYSRALLAAGEALKTNGTALDLNSAKALDNRDALEAVITASGDMYEQDIAAGIGLDIATAKHKARIQTLIDEAIKNGANEATVRNLVKAYDRVPGLVNTDVQTKGLDQVFKDLVNLAIAQKALQEGITPQAALAKYGWMYATPVYQGHAEGGPVHGPGGPTEDRVPAALMRGGRVVQQYRLSDGEYITKARAVDYYGPSVMNAINEMKVPRDRLLAQGGAVENWPFPLDVTKTLRPDISIFGPAGPGFGAWPGSPGAQRGDSGVWKSIVALIRSTGPLSGSFGNAYRPGDPLWHGSGRAVDWMGFNQDALALFLAAHRPLELIHRTASRDYAYTRGVNRGSFNNQLMQEHRNHIHIAMAEGGLLARVFDQGGPWAAGTVGVNTSGRTEHVVTGDGMDLLIAEVRLLRGAIDRVAPGVGAELTGAARRMRQTTRAGG